MEYQNLIKVLNQEKAQELINLGFKYIIESINDLTVYAFFISEELQEYLNSNFEIKDFFYENTLRF